METIERRSQHPSHQRALVAAFAMAALACVVVPSRDAAAQRLSFRHLTAADGLPASQVNATLRDSRGFMWIATAGGLGRYDGYEIVTYRHRRGDSLSLPGSHVASLYEDRSQTLWVGTLDGLSRLDRTSGAFVNVLATSGEGNTKRVGMLAMFEDRSGRFWIGTTEGVLLLDRRTGRTTPFDLPGSTPSKTCGIVQDRDGRIWIGTDGSGVYEVDGTTLAVRRHVHDSLDATTLPGNEIRALVELEGRLWVATLSQGLAAIDLKTRHVTRYRNDPAEPSSLPTDRLMRLLPARGGGGLWIGTENRGIAHLDLATGRFRSHPANPDDPASVSGSSIWSLYQGVGGDLWVGTFANGLNVSRQNGDAIRTYRSVTGSTNSLGSNTVVGFHEDRLGGIWIATDGGGLNHLDRATERVTRYGTANGLKSNAVLAVTEDREGTIWVGSWAGGVSRFDRRTQTFTPYTMATSNIQDDHIFSLHIDRAGRLWAGAFRSGLLLMDRERGTFTRYPLSETGRSPRIWLIRELHDGRFALATADERTRLVIFDPRTGGSQLFRSDSKDPNTLSSSSIGAMLEQTPGLLWVGTSAGLDRLNLTTGAVEHFTERDGLPGTAVHGLALDKQGKLWVSTDRGVGRFDPKSRTSTNYGPGDGLQGPEFTPRAYLHARDGSIFFGGTAGFSVIDPAKIVRNEVKPAVAITSFQLFNQPVTPGAKGSPLAAQITETKSIALDREQSVFTFGFASLDYMAPEKNQYAYRLEGFDRDWIHAGSSRSATYTSLPPGDYVFRVKASNNDGVWNEDGTAVQISIAPAIWETWWARTLMALALIAVLALVARSERRRHRRLAEMNQQLTQAAEHDRASQQYLEGNVLEMLGAMQRFSSGDYSVALDVRSEDAIGKLRHGFNAAVADRKRAEEELRQSQKMEAVGRLAGGVAHDFNNLLTVIKGNAELALLDTHDEAMVRAEITEVQRAAERAALLTRQLLAFSRKQILQPRTLSLREMVVDMDRLLQRTLGEDIAMRTLLDAELGMVRADPGQVQQVLLNLVVNARDAMPKGGELVISAENVLPADVADHPEANGGPYVAFSVRDTGMGMDPTVIERIFEPFFTTKEQGKGTGLGLSTVYGIVSQSGGYVRVESAVGRGTSFTVYLPRVDAEPDTRATLPQVAAGDCETILLVEDERSVRLLSARILQRAGYQVLSASHGDEAIEIAARYEGDIHLLLTDVVMPGLSGRELAQRLLPTRPGMRLLYVSGYTEDETVRHGVSGLGTAFLAKPFTPDTLVRKVSELLQESVADVPVA